MASLKLKDNATTTLASSIGTSTTSVGVANGGVFPSVGDFAIKIDSEYMLVTSRSGSNLTVTRGYRSTAQASHSSGATVELIVPAADLLSLSWVDVRSYGALGDGSTDDTSAIHAARDAAGTNGTLYFPAGTYRVGQLALNIAGQTWILARGATIFGRNGLNTDILNISVDDVTVRGDGILDGNNANQTGGSPCLITGSRCTIDGITINDAYSTAIYLIGSESSVIRNVTIDGSLLQGGIYGQNDSNNTLVENCRVVNIVAGTSIFFHSTNSGEGVDGTRVIGNYIEVGNASAFGIEIGPFGGNRPKNVIVANNVIVSTDDNFGGISLDNCDGAVVSGNHFEGAAFAIDIAGIELAGSNKCTLTGNYVSGTGLNHGFSIDRASYNSISGNTIDGYGTSGGIGIFIGSSQTSQVADYNTVSGNTIIAPSSTTDNAIWIQSNASGAHCNGNVIVGNMLHGAGTNKGIKLETDTGAVDKTIIVGNAIINFATATDTAGGTNTVSANNAT